MYRILGDLRVGWRVWQRTPASTLVILLTLAVGIGAATTVFSLADAILWRALPYRGEAMLVSIAEQRVREARLNGSVSPADFYDWRDQARSFSGVAAIEEPGIREMTFNRPGQSPEVMRTLVVTPNFLRVLGIDVVAGRDFAEADGAPQRDDIALLTEAVWRRRFGADPRVVGQSIELQGEPVTVVGVVAASFWWPNDPDILMPLARTGEESTMRASHFLRVIARRRPGVSAQAAETEMAAIGRRLETQYPDENTGHLPRLQPLRDALVGEVRTGLIVLVVSVGLLLLITGANVAALLLARAIDRQREFAVRAAMGASRLLLVRQILVESLALAAAGSAAGLLLASAAVTSLRQLLPAQFAALPGIASVGIDVRVAAVAVGATLLLMLAAAAFSAVAWWNRHAVEALRERQDMGGRRSQRARAALVTAELALSVVLLTGAALLILSFVNVTRISPGFEPSGVVAATIAVPDSRYETPEQMSGFFQRVVERLTGAAGVQAVAGVTSLPFAGADPRTGFRREQEEENAADAEPMRAHPRLITPGYFAVMRQPLVRGRDFTRADTGSTTDVVILNETAVRKFWRDREPLGQRMMFNLGPEARWLEVVGVVGDVRHDGLESEPRAEAYLPFTQPTFAFLGARMSVAVRSSLDEAAVAELVRAAVADIDPRQPVGLIQTLERLVAESMQTRRLTLMLLVGFAIVALLLSAAGLYGLISHAVAQRTREIGVRVALGATRARIVALVMRQSAVTIVGGLALGTFGAVAARRYVASLLYGVSASDPMVQIAVGSLLAFVAVAAVLLPSWRAAQTDPAVALQD